MVFNSLVFVLFFSVFFAVYWGIHKNLKLQNLFLLSGSYVFYAYADWRFLSLLVGVSLLNYLLGIFIEKAKSKKQKKYLLNMGLIQGIGGLAFFKYFNFFITSFNDAFNSIGVHLGIQTLHIIVPLGISFFTFRTISYLLDVDKGKVTATKDWVVFFNYVSFFPSVLSGPIDKAITFVPQLERKRTFDYTQATDGLRQILWGLFKKVVIADNCASISSQIFDQYQVLPASSLLMGAFIYTIEIYADFSGYSDMAIGFSRLIGFNISRNFDFPFFSQNIAEFWRKWHISLTSWLTEYVFTPLSIAFRDWGNLGIILAIVINITLMGIWHGANWTFVVFGFLHGCYFIPLILRGSMFKKKTIAKGKRLPNFRESLNMMTTFAIVMFTFIVFKSQTLEQAYHYYLNLFSTSIFSMPALPSGKFSEYMVLIFVAIMLGLEWVGGTQAYALEALGLHWRRPLRWAFYSLIIFAIGMFMQTSQTPFIYFQF